jgi:hypothetical protein
LYHATAVGVLATASITDMTGPCGWIIATISFPSSAHRSSVRGRDKELHDHLFALFPRVARKKRKPKQIEYHAGAGERAVSESLLIALLVPPRA